VRSLLIELQCKLRETEHELRAAQAAVHDAESRAARAERSAREAWAFAQVINRVTRRTG
jgi:hypothetical protein